MLPEKLEYQKKYDFITGKLLKLINFLEDKGNDME